MTYQKKSYVEHVAVRVKDIHWHIRFFREVLGMTIRDTDGPEGDPLKCQLARPHGIFVDSDGAIFIGDTETQRVRVIRQ